MVLIQGNFSWVKRQPIREGNLIAHISVVHSHVQLKLLPHSVQCCITCEGGVGATKVQVAATSIFKWNSKELTSPSPLSNQKGWMY